MAEIRVERKKGGAFPLWLIPLLLLLLLLPLLYFYSKSGVVDNTNVNANRGNVNTAGAGNRVGATNTGNNAIVVNNGGSNAVGNGARDGSVIKNVNEFNNTADKSTIVGRGFFANDVRVRNVLSDKVFTVKSGAGEMFVMLDDNLDSTAGNENRIRIRRGQKVNLGGEFRNVPAGETEDEHKEGGLSKREYAKMKEQQVYLHATSVSNAK